jgi:hypothetical protein
MTRAGSYDLAGTGLSEPGPMRRTSVHIAEELRTALHQAGVGGPYILVGSAFGGDDLRTFADCTWTRAVLACAQLHSAMPLCSGSFRVDIALQAAGDEPWSGLNTQKRK